MRERRAHHLQARCSAARRIIEQEKSLCSPGFQSTRSWRGKSWSTRDRQSELIKMLKELEAAGLPVISTVDKTESEKEVPLAAIDPFTFFASFNRAITKDNRSRILAYLKTEFHLQSEVPTDFYGIPVVDNRRAWFFRT